jgi:beta-RFAP synthase
VSIIEGVVTTLGPGGRVNVAPMGPLLLDDDFGVFLLRPYTSSRTYANLKEHPEGVFHVTDDVELIARAVAGDVEPPMRPAERVRGWVLTGACRYFEFRIEDFDDREPRTRLRARTVHSGRLRDFIGFHRARHAVIEAAILASRVGILPLEEILGELRRLEAPIEKTGGASERRAFELLRRHVLDAAGGVSLDRVEVRTGSRLHFGLLAPWPGLEREHGGAGLMVESPGIELVASRAEGLEISGPHAERVRESAAPLLDDARRRGAPLAGARIEVRRAAPLHAGLGTGTQLALAAAAAIDRLSLQAGAPPADAVELARRAARVPRSGIGIHGFARGGLLVDGGHAGRDGGATATPFEPAPLVSRLELPAHWRALVILPPASKGLSGDAERDAFHRLGGLPAAERAERAGGICRAALLGLLPALAEGDFPAFSRALWDFSRRAGEAFRAIQGGSFASGAIQAAVELLRAEGIEGVGQSSWGPAVFAIVDDAEKAAAIAARARARFSLADEAVLVTAARNRGADVHAVPKARP